MIKFQGWTGYSKNYNTINDSDVKCLVIRDYIAYLSLKQYICLSIQKCCNALNFYYFGNWKLSIGYY